VVTAAGQALLAGFPRAEQEGAGAGYAIDQEECEPGVVAVAAPVRDPARRVVGAVECGAPAFRWTLDRLKGELAPLVADAASQIEAGLGLRQGAP
jgi:IclR family pca regulon transcriptional regulator